MKSAVSTTLTILALFVTPIFARTWTEAGSGKTIEADLVKIEDGKAHLKLANGRIAPVPIPSLSPDDQAYITTQEKQMATTTGSASQWPSFRGPKADDISPDTGLLKKWPDGGPKKLWVYEQAGMGYSGFSIVDGKLYTQGTRGDDVTVICIDASTGKEKWATKVSKDDGEGYNSGWGNGPRGTPTYSDERVYTLDPKGVVSCLDANDGKVVWQKNLLTDFGGEMGGWGYAESPLVDGSHVILAPGGKKAGMVALDKVTGATVWEAKELTPGKAEYASILVAEINGVRQYVKLFEQQLVGVAAADGRVVWSSPWEGKVAVIPTPIVRGNEVYISSGYGIGCKLIKIDADNKPSDVWQNKAMVNHHGGVVLVDDHLYGFSDAKGLICQNWKDGEMVWNEKGQYTLKGAVHVADGHLYALNEDDGTVTLVKIDPKEYKQDGQFKLEPQSANRHPKGKIWTHPVVLNGKLYLRDQEYIVCYDVKG